jgi:hypothetical protein
MSYQDYQNSKMMQFMNRNIWLLIFVLLSLNMLLVIKIWPYQNSLKERSWHSCEAQHYSTHLAWEHQNDVFYSCLGFYCHWSLGTLLSVSSDKLSEAQYQSRLKHIASQNQRCMSTFQSYNNIMHAFGHGTRSQNTGFEVHQTEAYLHKNVQFTSYVHICRSRN